MRASGWWFFGSYVFGVGLIILGHLLSEPFLRGGGTVFLILGVLLFIALLLYEDRHAIATAERRATAERETLEQAQVEGGHSAHEQEDRGP